ncbi:MAG: hypothetical protein MAG715_00973 [Methanonatronarchaeales archaeon]|nr:hypothetical protein [Methanonatronarchaeales archaeon]
MMESSQAIEVARDVAGRLVLEESRGSLVRGLRVKTGLTQSELAGILGTTRERVSRVENGHVAPSVDFLERCSKTFALGEVAREMDIRGELDHRELVREANRLGVDEEDLDLLLIEALTSLDEKRRSLIREL